MRETLDKTIRALAPIERPPGSEGERHAAEWIAERIGGRLEEHPVHGNFWRPIGLLAALVALIWGMGYVVADAPPAGVGFRRPNRHPRLPQLRFVDFLLIQVGKQ